SWESHKSGRETEV
nr:Chain E, CYTO8-RETEV [synthetic construct]5EYZ_F Chain F, CYTO8-RETEV [synthetic construct]5EYZ_G Chain G, CYTO8-RETEV [synthetic construct]5EYZ_H Chain H, CYTO8-RETEV [synthetic construct]